MRIESCPLCGGVMGSHRTYGGKGSILCPGEVGSPQ